MFDAKFLRSIALKGLYVVVAAAVFGLSGWLDANPDVGLWTMERRNFASNIFGLLELRSLCPYLILLIF